MSHSETSPVGEPVPGWTPRPRPGGTFHGRTCQIEPLAAHHVEPLHQALNVDSPATLWTYYPAGPYRTVAEFGAWLATIEADPASEPHVVLTPDGSVVGLLSYLRIDRDNGVVELGNVVLSARLQRTTAATEAIYLMIQHAFGLGFRRFEWKCDSLNEPSRKAAKRFGFSYEGAFRQAIVYRGRNRDTAWFSILDHEWAVIQPAFTRWLSPDNFAADGAQLSALEAGRAGSSG